MSQHSVTPSPEASPRSRSSRRIARAVPVATLLAGALALAGCGGDDDDSKEPPATPAAAASFSVTSELAASVPGDAVLFAEVKLNPDGEQKAALDELVGLFGDDAEESLVKELGLDEDENGVSFQKDIVPYLGERAGGFGMIDPNATKTKTTKDDEPDGALVVQVKDQAKLTASIEKSNDRSTKKVKVAGQDAYRDDEGFTLWVGEKLAVAGTEKAVTAAIEAQGGETLDKNERFTTALKQVRGNDPLALGWSDLQNASALGAALMSLDEESGDALKELQGSDLGGASADLKALEQFSKTPIPDIDATVAMALLPKPGELKLEFGGTQPKPATGSAEQIAKAGSDAVAALPPGSWLAFGSSLEAASSIPGYSLEDQLKQVEDLTGEKLPAGLTDTLGKIKTVAVGIKGDSLLAIGGAAIVQATDAAAATQMLKTIEGELPSDGSLTVEKTPIPGADESIVIRTPELPIRIAVGVKGDRLVIGLGAEAVTNALEGTKTLSGDAAYTQAKDALGGDAPSMLVNPAPLAQLLSDLPAGSGDANEMTEIVNAVKGIKLMAASQVATGDTSWRGAFVLRYDAALLKQTFSGLSGSGGSKKTAPPTVTDATPGR
ncbi:MAG: DUF3352 domain-containing protein [Patulibacter sp.]